MSAHTTMANLQEVEEFTDGVYQIETADPVIGGPTGISNVQAKALANRTQWLKAQIQALAEVASTAIDDQHLQAAIDRLPTKAHVVAVATSNIVLSGLQTIDALALNVGNRVLVAAQTTAAQNGIWLAQESAWVRAQDLNADIEVQPGVQVMVTNGSTYADTIWHLVTDGTITIGTSAQVWKCLTHNTALLGNPTAPTAAQGTNNNQLATTAFVQALASSVSVPAGAVSFFAQSAAPTGWLKANGAAVSRTTYAALFAAIGTTYGAGDGSSTFNLPDMRGEFVRGLDDGRGVDTSRSLGSAQSSANLSHTHTGTTGNQSADHTHSGTTSTNGDHNHGVPDQDQNAGFGGNFDSGGVESVDRYVTTTTNGAHNHTITTGGASANHTHSFTTASSGGDEARPRNVALLACIKF